MATIIALTNHKGGVGKTTSVASISASLASKGYRTLMVDLDTQANLTGSFLPDDQQERTIYNALKERKDIPIINIKPNLDIVPSSLSLAGIEIELSSAISREYILRELLIPLNQEYEFILLDCPPSLGLITINALAAAHEVIVPLTAEALPFKGLLPMVQEIIDMVRERLNPKLRLCGILLSRWEGRKLNRMVENTLRENFGDIVFNTRIRTNIAIAEAPLVKKDIFDYNYSCNGATDFNCLTEELIEKVHN